jgi:hypothetical protein
MWKNPGTVAAVLVHWLALAWPSEGSDSALCQTGTSHGLTSFVTLAKPLHFSGLGVCFVK